MNFLCFRQKAIIALSLVRKINFEVKSPSMHAEDIIDFACLIGNIVIKYDILWSYKKMLSFRKNDKKPSSFPR